MERRALGRMAAFHVIAGVAVAGGGYLAGSQALTADALDFLGIGSIAAIALAGIGRDHTRRSRAALVQAVVRWPAQLRHHHRGAVADDRRARAGAGRHGPVRGRRVRGQCGVRAWLVLKDHGSETGAMAIRRQGRAELIEDAAILAAALVVGISQCAMGRLPSRRRDRSTAVAVGVDHDAGLPRHPRRRKPETADRVTPLTQRPLALR